MSVFYYHSYPNFCYSLKNSLYSQIECSGYKYEYTQTLEQNGVLSEFDRYVFESIVEKVIVGGYDEDRNKDPT
ncbi:hypothetical protein UT300005_33850 [Clostridium sp. CTA-5]